MFEVAMQEDQHFNVDIEMMRQEREALWKRVFLCHASKDKTVVRLLWRLLKKEGFNPWLDEENLSAGQKWQDKISHAVQETEIVLICLSLRSVTKDGYVQEEVGLVLNETALKPKDSIFLVPVLLESCVMPERLSDWHSVTLFERGGYEDLLGVLTNHFRVKGNARKRAAVEEKRTEEQKAKAAMIERLGPTLGHTFTVNDRDDARCVCGSSKGNAMSWKVICDRVRTL